MGDESNRLPIDDVVDKIVGHISETGALVLKAEPGAGKTTRVPSAILDAGLSTLDDRRHGKIVVLQPRRIAARAAAERMSRERGTALGADIGYRVRHEGRCGRDTRILVCTVGVFLRWLQDDPTIEDVSVVIFDEFHERTVDGDLALALTRQVQETIRSDLRIVVMSATLESAPISSYLGNAPVVECPGRTYPIEIEYLKFPSNVAPERLSAELASQVLGKSAGHLLIFQPGLGEIRKTRAILEASLPESEFALLELYGDMELSAQQVVLQESAKRKVILATNVAETSLTIAGVDAVIDTGLARVNRFDPTVGINRLELCRISKASAAQRAGRAGRTAPGICLRLWTEREQMAFADFEKPEIERLELSESVLQLITWGEKDIYAFPWFEPPPLEALDRALQLLERLGAIRSGKLTDLGRAMAQLPLQPRLACLLLTGARMGQVKRTALCAALLSERPPFRNQDVVVAAHHTESDVLEQVRALEAYSEDKNSVDSIMGEILPGPAKHVLRAAAQLTRLVIEQGHSEAIPLSDTASGDIVLQSILAAFPDRICNRRQPKDTRGVMVGGRGVKLSDQSTVLDAQLFAAVDLIDLNKPELSVRRASSVQRDWLPDGLMTSSVEVEFDKSREKVVAFKRTRFCDLLLDEVITRIPPDVDPGAVLAESIATGYDIESLVDDSVRELLLRIAFLREWVPELDLPEYGESPWQKLLPLWCCGATSLSDLQPAALTQLIESNLTRDQYVALDKEAPQFIGLPNGRKSKLTYQDGKAPILSARIQDFLGMTNTPRIARSRVPVTVHLLAPNYRVQQITDDLMSFWKNTYPTVKKDLKGRYPKHSWPDDPLKQ
ncbi:MAG: ATP-dependent helicase HrpB [Candidatus Obscuribacterales bacterium]|nr:ATP-dependent helicase HrpB [Candidatus Obscuribacterales bacterium]